MFVSNFISKILIFSLLTGVLVVIVVSGINYFSEPRVWNNDGNFDLEPFDTGNIKGQFFIAAPWGGESWGIEGASFDKDHPEHTISGASFISWGNEGYLYGKEEAGYWSFVRYVQGDVWGGSYEGPVPWHVPAPLNTYNKNLVLSIDINRDSNKLLSSSDSWHMFAINVWLNSPDIPKRLVLDLIFYHDCNWQDCSWGHFEDEDAYHYQAFIGETPYREWQSWIIDLDWHIKKALETFDLRAGERSAKLYQLEFVIELKNAEGAAMIKNFFLLDQR